MKRITKSKNHTQKSFIFRTICSFHLVCHLYAKYSSWQLPYVAHRYRYFIYSNQSHIIFSSLFSTLLWLDPITMKGLGWGGLSPSCWCWSVLSWVDWDQSLFFFSDRKRNKEDTRRKKKISITQECWSSFFRHLFLDCLLNMYAFADFYMNLYTCLRLRFEAAWCMSTMKMKSVLDCSSM
jgi:hypothetical protein